MKGALVLVLLLTSCQAAGSEVHLPPAQVAVSPSASQSPVAGTVFTPRKATKTSGCRGRLAANGATLPDPDCTPGATNPKLTKDVLCADDFRTAPYRTVTDAQRRRIFAAYGTLESAPGYVLDHVIALEDGGSSVDANLFPEPKDPAPGHLQKDRVETYLRREVCAGRMQLAYAQALIAGDWTVVLLQGGAGALRGIEPKLDDD